MKYTRSGRKKSNRRTRKILTHLPMPLFRSVRKAQHGGGVIWQTFGEYIVESIVGAGNDGRIGENNLIEGGVAESTPTRVDSNGTTKTQVGLRRIGEGSSINRGLDTSGNGPYYKNLTPYNSYNSLSCNIWGNPGKVRISPTAGGTVTIPVHRDRSYVAGIHVLVQKYDDAMNTSFTGKVLSYTNGPALGTLIINEIANIKGSFNNDIEYSILASQPYQPQPSLYAPLKIAVDSAENIFIVEGSVHGNSNGFRMYSTAEKKMESYGRHVGQMGVGDQPNNSSNFSSFAIYRNQALAVDKKSDVVIIADSAYHHLRSITKNDKTSFSGKLGIPENGAVYNFLSSNKNENRDGADNNAALQNPVCIAIDPTIQRGYVCDNVHLMMIDMKYPGNIAIPSGNSYYYSRLWTPPGGIRDMVVDSSGNIFALCASNMNTEPLGKQRHAVWKIVPPPPGTTNKYNSTKDLGTPILNQSTYPVPPPGMPPLVKPIIFAGSETEVGHEDDVGENARFNNPMGISIDSKNNLYIADAGNNVIRCITPQQRVFTLAGAGSAGTEDLGGTSGDITIGDGAAEEAKFSVPISIAVANSNNIYVLDRGLYGMMGVADNKVPLPNSAYIRIRKLIRIPAPAAPTTFTFVSSDSISATFTWAGALTGHENKGSSAYYKFLVKSSTSPSELSYAIDGTTPYDSTKRGVTASKWIVDNASSKPQQGFYLNNIITLPLEPNTTYSSIKLVAFNGSGENASNALTNIVIPAASSNYTILKCGSLGSKGFANGPALSSKFMNPRGLAADATNTIYVADTDNHCIRKIDPKGVSTTFFGTPSAAGSSLTTLSSPMDLTFSNGGVWPMYVADNGNNRVVSITSAGVATVFGSSGVSLGSPSGITVDTINNVYVASNGQHCIYMITPAGVAGVLAGSPGQNGSTDGPAAAARFYSPYGLHYNIKYSCLYVADTENHIIRKITLTTPVTVYTLAGKAATPENINGLGSIARFSGPRGLTSDLSGTVYVCDYNNNMIRKVTIAGLVSAYSGTGTQGSANGSAKPESFSKNSSTTTYNAPYGICNGASGFMFISEIGNQCIRLLSPYPPPIAPTSLFLSAVTKNSATISWAGDSGATSYSFTISPSSASIIIPVVAIGTKTATFTGLTESTEYTITLILTNDVGSTFPPGVKIVTMIDSSSVKLNSPEIKSFSLRSVPSTLVTASFSWSGLVGVPLISYTLTSSGASGASDPVITGVMPPNQRSPFTIVGLQPKKTYSCRIRGTLTNYISPTTGAIQPASISYIRFTVKQTVGGTNNDYSVASFSIMNGTAVLPWPAGTRVYPVAFGTTTPLTVANPADGGPQNLLNNSNTIGKYFPWYPRGTGSTNPAAVVFALGTPIVFNGYRFGVADTLSRTPNRWRLEYSTDGVEFITVDNRTTSDQTVPTTINTYTEVYPLNIPDSAVSNEVTFTTQEAAPMYINTIAGRKEAQPTITTATVTPSEPLTTQLNTIRGITKDLLGNLYVASVTCILKLSPPTIKPVLYAFDTTQSRPTPMLIESSLAGLKGYTISLFAGATTEGFPTSTIQTGSSIRFRNISGMIYSSSNNCLYVSDFISSVVIKVTLSVPPTATVIAGIVSNPGNQDGMLGTNRINIPKGLTEGSDGTLFICDHQTGICRLDVVTGNLTRISKVANQRPEDIVAFPDGSLYYSSAFDHAIYKLTPDPGNPGTYTDTVFAGFSQPAWSSGKYQDGPLLSARFDGPQGLTIDSNYNMYVYDSNNYAIRMITGGNVYTIMGGVPPNVVSPANADGPIANARVKGDPGSRVAVHVYTDLFSDPNGNLYLSDFGNGTLRLITNFLTSQLITQEQLDYYKTSGANASSALAQRESSSLAQSISGARASSAVAQVASQAVASSALELSALSGPVLAKNEVISRFNSIKTDLAAQTAIVYSPTASSTAKAAARSLLVPRLGDLQTWLENLAATSSSILAIAPMYQDRDAQSAVSNTYLQSVGSIKIYDRMRKAYMTINSTTGHIVPNIEIPSRRPFVSGQRGSSVSGASLNVWSSPLSTDILLPGDLTLPTPSIWASYFDTVGRRYFYVNTNNKTSQYEHPFPPVLSSNDQILTDTTTEFLPAGWLKLQNSAKNLPYYLNVNTTETSWEHPAPPPNPKTSTLAIDATLFPAYKKYISTTAPTTGKGFYVNAVTDEAQWNFPDSAFNVGPSTAQQASSALAQQISGAQVSSAVAQGASSAVRQTASSALAQQISGAQVSSAVAQGASSAVRQRASSALAQQISGARVSSAQASSANAQRASSAVQQRDSRAQQQAASSSYQQRDSSAQQQIALGDMIAIKDRIKNELRGIQSTISDLTDTMNGKGPSTSVTNIPVEIESNLLKLADKKSELFEIGQRIFQLSPEYQDSSLQTIVKDDTLSAFQIKKVFDTLRNTHIFLDANQRIVNSPLTPGIRAYTAGTQYGGSKHKKGSRKSSILFYRV